MVLVVAQAAWGYGGFFGWNFPANAFATGAFREAGTIWPTKFARLSGSPQEMPTLLGGPVRGPRFCGAVEGQARPPILPAERVAPYRENWAGWPSLRRLLTAQAPVLATVLIAIVCLMPVWRGLGMVVLFSSFVAAALLCGSRSGFTSGGFLSFDARMSMQEDEKLVGSVRLSPEFLETLQQTTARDEQIELFVRLRPLNAGLEHSAEFQVAEWSSSQSRFTVPGSAFLDAVRARSGRVEFSIAPAAASKGLLLHSWQATNGDRRAQLVHADGTQEQLDRFPSFEIRVVRPKSEFAFQKLIERFEPTRPASYVLVGF
jgi:hypothetical protein